MLRALSTAADELLLLNQDYSVDKAWCMAFSVKLIPGTHNSLKEFHESQNEHCDQSAIMIECVAAVHPVRYYEECFTS